MNRKRESSIKTRVTTSRFPYVKTIEQFDFSFQPSLNEKEIARLGSLAFIEEKGNVIFLGPPGVGKTHLAVGLGVKACMTGYRILFLTVQKLLEELTIAKREGNLLGKILTYGRLHLLFYQRLKETYSFIEQIRDIPPRRDNKAYEPLYQLFKSIKKVIDDPVLSKAVARVEERVEVFDNLRKALRIALPEGKKGLNDDGDDTDIKTIEEKVKEFRDQITTDKHLSQKDVYKKMVQQIDAYWEKLFADPIPVDTPWGRVFIQPQRTNNVLERLFRYLKRRWRKKAAPYL